MNSINDVMYYPKLDESVKGGLNNVKDPKTAAKQVEQVFMNELLKNMLENTEFGRDKMVSSYMPYITSEISKSISERGIGIHEFLMKSPAFSNIVNKKGAYEDHGSSQINKLDKTSSSGEGLKVPVRGGIGPAYGKTMRQNMR